MPDPAPDADRLAAAVEHPPAATAAAVVSAHGVTRAVLRAGSGDRFELGSLTKTMTAQVLASLVLDDTVSLDDEVGRWLDAGPNGSITLGQLARHRSGLPRLAPNTDAGTGFDILDPYAAYTGDLAEEALRTAEVDPDRPSLYSNFGYQLLGLALERAAGRSLEELFQVRVFEPFGLMTASVGPHPELVPGYRNGEPTRPWRVVLAGPGGVVGTIDDLVAWGSAVLDPPAGEAGEALRLATEPDPGGTPVGLGWQLRDDLIWHNGGTGGFLSCLAVSRQHRRVAACLVAAADLDHVDDATFLAARGINPVAARPEPAGDQRDEAALALARALADHDWGAVHAAMSDSCRAALTEDRLSGAWAQLMEPRGQLQSAVVQHARRKGQAIEVAVNLTFEADEGWAQVFFDEAGRVVGLRIG